MAIPNPNPNIEDGKFCDNKTFSSNMIDKLVKNVLPKIEDTDEGKLLGIANGEYALIPGFSINTLTYKGTGTNPVSITFPKKPTIILSIDADGDINYVSYPCFRYGSKTAGGFYKGQGAGTVSTEVTYSEDELTMTLTGNDAGAVCNYLDTDATVLWI